MSWITDAILILNLKNFLNSLFLFLNKENQFALTVRPIGTVVQDIVLGTRGSGLVSRAGQTGRIVANVSPLLRRFFAAMLPWHCTPELGLATYYKFLHNLAYSVMKI